MARTLKDYPAVALSPEDLDGKIDFVRIFGRSGPVHIEIGTGKATFLLNEAMAQPNVNFFGIERARKYYRCAVDRIGRWDLKNVRIIRTDAAAFLADFVPDNSIDCFHIYFPDPWPKRRHHKRRFFHPENLQQLLRCLKAGGNLKIATDHADYFQQIRKVLAVGAGQCACPSVVVGPRACPSLEEIEFLPAAGADTGEWTGTNYERKYLKKQIPIYTLAVRKI